MDPARQRTQLLKAPGIDSLGTAYDYNSVMHYNEYQFTTDPTQKTMYAKENTIGQRKEISRIDINQSVG